jgi:hypothetical protein
MVVRSRIGVALLATALIVVIACSFVVLPQRLGNGLRVSSATAPPKWRIHRPTGSPVADSSFGAGLLLQPSDLRQPGLQVGDATRRQDGGQRLTGCTGQQTMAGLITGDTTDASFVSVLWRGTPATGIDEVLLRESVLRVRTHAAADRYATSLIDQLTNCTYRRHGRHCHLDRPATVPTEVGEAVRLVAYDADGSAVGGVGVFVNHRTVGVFDLHAPGIGKAEPALDSLSVAAVRRIS